MTFHFGKPDQRRYTYFDIPADTLFRYSQPVRQLQSRTQDVHLDDYRRDYVGCGSVRQDTWIVY